MKTKINLFNNKIEQEIKSQVMIERRTGINGIKPIGIKLIGLKKEIR